MWKLIGSPYNIVFHLTAPGRALRLGSARTEPWRHQAAIDGSVLPEADAISSLAVGQS